MEEHKQNSTPIHEKKKFSFNFNFNYDNHYKKLLLIPVILLIASIAYLFYFHSQTGDFIIKDISLSGGTTLTLSGNVLDKDLTQLEEQLKSDYDDVSFRRLTDTVTGRTLAFVVESHANPDDLESSVEEIIDIDLNSDNSNIEFSDSGLGSNFYKQLIIALFVSFILMSIVIFIMFRSFIPSIAVIFAAFADIVMPLALIDYLGIKISAAGIAAFLMLIGYSVDTDILLTTRALKKQEGTLNERIYGAFKTGIFMNLTALAAVLPAFFIITGLPDSFRQIFFILAVGLFADVLNTWLTNASIIKWYCDKKGIK